MVVEKPLHMDIKEIWTNTLKEKGFMVETEKRIYDSNNKLMIADVYAEREDLIVIVEAVTTNWAGKNPRDYINTNKEVQLIIAHPISKNSVKAISENIPDSPIIETIQENQRLKKEIERKENTIKKMGLEIRHMYSETSEKSEQIKRLKKRILGKFKDKALLSGLSSSFLTRNLGFNEVEIMSLSKDYSKLKLDNRILRKLIPVFIAENLWSIVNEEEKERINYLYSHVIEEKFFKFANLSYENRKKKTK